MTNRFVYFIEAEGFRRVKIGLARDPAARLKDLQTASPAKLRLAAVLETDDARACEAWLHGHFGDQRVQGEWFRSGPSLRRLIRALEGWPLRATFAGKYRPTMAADTKPGMDSDQMAKHLWHACDVLGYWSGEQAHGG